MPPEITDVTQDPPDSLAGSRVETLEPETSAEWAGAGILRRTVARLLDYIFFNIAYLVFNVALGLPLVVLAGMAGAAPEVVSERLARLTFTSFVIAVAAGVGYHTVFEGVYGATPGKRLFGLVVVGENLTRCTLTAALKRNLLRGSGLR